MQQQQHHQRSPRPPSPQPPGNYDEASVQQSRHFIMAVQELRNLRPQLYSAAEYCESSYLHSDQKHVVLDNLKDYSVKALVNAVDHVGTVAYKLNDLLSQQTTDISRVELQVACLTQRLRACQEHRNTEGLKQHRLTKTIPRYHQYYVLPDAVTGIKEKAQEKQPSPMQQIQPEHPEESVRQVPNVGRSLSWHLAAEAHSTLNGGMPNLQRQIRLASSESVGEGFPTRGVIRRSSSGGQTTMSSPGSNTPNSGHNRAHSVQSSRSLSSLLSFDESRQSLHRPAPTRSKSLISSFLGRRRSGKVQKRARTHSLILQRRVGDCGPLQACSS